MKVIVLFFFRKNVGYVLPMFRLCQYLNRKSGLVVKLLKKLTYRRYSKLTKSFNVSLPIDAIIRRGLCFPHQFTLVINPSATIGKNCIIHPCVLIARDRNKEGAPIIGDNCFIGYGANLNRRLVLYLSWSGNNKKYGKGKSNRKWSEQSVVNER